MSCLSYVTKYKTQFAKNPLALAQKQNFDYFWY